METAAVPLAWALVGVQAVVTIACAVHVVRRHRHDATGLPRTVHRTALVLLVACALPLPALLAATAPVAAWGLWGGLYIAAALVYATGDTYRDIPTKRTAGQEGRT